MIGNRSRKCTTARCLAWVLCGVLALPLAAFGQEMKIGYVNVVKVIEEAPQGDAARKKLEAEFKPRDKELVATRKKLRDLEAELDKKSLVLSDSKRIEKERELITLRRQLKQAAQEFREDYNLRRNEELAALQKTVYKVIVSIAKEDQYDLILHEGAVYASDKIDITEKVLDKLNQQH
jgi:outer membrane protein